jgi:DNA polymerase (family 10)
MPIHNSEIADRFNELATLLEIEGANEFRVRAYRTAARNIGTLPESVASMVEQGEDLSKLPGLGKDLAGKVQQIVQTGSLPQLEELKERIPTGLIELAEVEGLGPKRVGAIYQRLQIQSLDALERAAREGQIRELPGFGAKTEQSILEEIERKRARGPKRTKLSVAEELVQPLLDYLGKGQGVVHVDAAGSYRRRRETVGDLDVLVSGEAKSDVMDRFVGYEDVEHVVSKGETKSSVAMRFGLQVDLRVVGEESFGAALHYFTGSKDHNIAVRKLGLKRNLKINEYGVFQGEERVAGRNEQEVYDQVELPYIEPELRENRGEIEAARDNRLPELVSLDEIRGDLHAHTKATDGRSTLEEMAQAAQERGYEYLAITDHSKHVTVARGLDEGRLSQQIDEIDRLNEQFDGFRLLKGIEVDILEDGSLDLSDDVLSRLDIVVGAVHYKFNLSRDKQTERVLRAMDNRYFNILAHPTGRMIDERDPYDIDIDQTAKAAKERGCYLELNAQPERLDLTDIHCKKAKEMGVGISISTDAHHTRELDFIRFGVGQARRGWLEASDVINTRGLSDLRELLRRQ